MKEVSEVAYEDLYKNAMNGIAFKVAMQAIRKVLRDNSLDDVDKLGKIIIIVHSFERDMDK